MGWIDKAHRIVTIIAKGLTLAGAYLLLAAALLTCLDIFTRFFFIYSIAGTDELSSYALAVATSCGFAYATLERAHIRMDVVYRFFPAPLRAFLDLVATVSLLAISILFMQQALLQFIESARFGVTANTPLRTPLWIPQSLWIGGLAVFVLAGLALAAATARKLLSKNYDEASALSGVPSITDKGQAIEP